ncbi:hypothetical protein D3C85_1700760 [compost metagenome]
MNFHCSEFLFRTWHRVWSHFQILPGDYLPERIGLDHFRHFWVGAWSDVRVHPICEGIKLHCFQLLEFQKSRHHVRWYNLANPGKRLSF